MSDNESGKSGRWIVIFLALIVTRGLMKLGSSSSSSPNFSAKPGEVSYYPYATGAGFPTGVNRDVTVSPYQRSDGTYVPGHNRSYPDGISQNNWSNYPNVNPYTGARGSRR